MGEHVQRLKKWNWTNWRNSFKAKKYRHRQKVNKIAEYEPISFSLTLNTLKLKWKNSVKFRIFEWHFSNIHRKYPLYLLERFNFISAKYCRLRIQSFSRKKIKTWKLLHPTNIHLLKVNNRNTKKRCFSDVSIVNFDQE